MEPKVKRLRESIFAAGYNYAKECFKNFEDDEDMPRLPDGRVDPNVLAIYDAPYEILGGCADEVLKLDPIYFPGQYTREQLWELMATLLEGEEDYIFIEGEKEYITEIYGEDWENNRPTL